MEQHPVPQHIASFEFKLFGNLTAKQFVTLAIPMGLAAAIFFSSLPAALRLSLAIVIGLVGLFIALVPINGRTFDKWVVLFIKAVLAPTQKIWVKENKIPDFLKVVVTLPPTEEKIPETITTLGRERLQAYLRSLPKKNANLLDIKEQIAVERLGLEIPKGQKPESTEASFLPPAIIWPILNQSLPQVASPSAASPMQPLPAP